MLWYRSVCDIVLQECVGVCLCVMLLYSSAAALLWVLYVTQSSSSSAQRCVFRAVAHCRPPTALLAVLVTEVRASLLSTCSRSQLQHCSLCVV